MDKKKILNKMENKEPSPTSPITTTEKKTKPNDPGRIAAGKKLAEHNKKAREAKKASQENKEIPNEKKDEIAKEQGSFSLTQILSVVSIVVSLAGLYYKRKELMSLVKPSRERRVDRTEEITEEDLKRLRESHREAESNLKDSKLKPMD